jgi:hypothetical protein
MVRCALNLIGVMLRFRSWMQPWGEGGRLTLGDYSIAAIMPQTAGRGLKR